MAAEGFEDEAVWGFVGASEDVVHLSFEAVFSELFDGALERGFVAFDEFWGDGDFFGAVCFGVGESDVAGDAEGAVVGECFGVELAWGEGLDAVGVVALCGGECFEAFVPAGVVEEVAQDDGDAFADALGCDGAECFVE